MKPLIIDLMYNDKTKDKAFEIYETIKKNYRLYHENRTILVTPMFTVRMYHYYDQNRFYGNADIYIIPNTMEMFCKVGCVKIIKYSPEEVISLWEQY